MFFAFFPTVQAQILAGKYECVEVCAKWNEQGT